jgi:FtsP/CotA-like multicopper oxidase with cupredoxin domain
MAPRHRCRNSRFFPGIDSPPVRLGDRVRIRVVNLTMSNHPIQMPGHESVVACEHPKGTVAYDWTGGTMNPQRAPVSNSDGSQVHHHPGAPWRAVKPRGGHKP